MDAGRLLVVDDSPTVRKLVELTFPGTGWRIDFAASGAQALELVKQTVPDVVLLDFILPDMRGTDVCERLSLDTRTANVPVVVMSGKGDSISPLFQAFPAFFACIGKPSTSAQIRSTVDAAFASKRPAQAPSRSQPSMREREIAAKAVYSLLRDALGQIPRWMGELGDAAPAAFFARKLLTPELIGRLLEALGPRAVEAAPQPSSTAQESPFSAGASFHGAVTDWPVAGLLTFLESSGRSGELSIAVDGKCTIAYLRAGEVILVTNREPTEYLRGNLPSAARLGAVPREVLRAAEAQQRATGVPVFVTLAAAGHFPLAELTETLRARGRKLLLDAIEARKASFAWRDLGALPDYVEAHGRHVSTARNTLVFGAADGAPPESVSLRQLALERLRQEPPHDLPPADTVFSRARGFSAKVSHFDLTSNERRVLSLVDGVSRSRDLSARAGLGVDETLAILARLTDVELLRNAGESSRGETSSAPKTRPLMILEPDVRGFQAPLAALLQKRAAPVALYDLSREKDMVAAVRREQPRAVILNAATEIAANTARQLRADTDLNGLLLVAVLEPQMAPRAEEFLAIGFDKTLVKPVAYSEIERLLA